MTAASRSRSSSGLGSGFGAPARSPRAGGSASAASRSSVPWISSRAHMMSTIAAMIAMIAIHATTGCSCGSGCSWWLKTWTMPVRRYSRPQVRASELFTRDRHVLHEDRAGRAAAAHHHVAAYGRDLLEHLLQVAGDGYLFDRKSDLAALDPVAGGAARVV